MNLFLWIRAMRVPFFTAAIIPVFLGFALAWHDTSRFVWQQFLWTLLGAVFIHAATNLANDYFDHKAGCDEANPTPTPFSGGSRVIQDGLIAPKPMLMASLIFFILGGTIGLYLNFLSGDNVILYIGTIGFFLAFFYSARPFTLGYGSLGELATGIGFGPLIVMGSYYVSAHSLSWRVFFISIPVGMLIALVLFINEFPDWFGDKKSKKRTWVVILGKKKAAMLFQQALWLTYILVVLLVFVGYLPVYSLLCFLSLPLAIKADSITRRHFEKIQEFLPANAAMIGIHSLMGLFISLGLVLDKFFMAGR